MNEVQNKLLKELKLHDATISSMKLTDDSFYFMIDCKGMEINNIFNELDNIFFIVKCFDVIKINFDFEDMILIDKLSISEKDGIVIIDTLNGDLYVECKKYDVELGVIYNILVLFLH